MPTVRNDLALSLFLVALHVTLLGACTSPAAKPSLALAEYEARVEAGRALLDSGRFAEAEAAFNAAAAADGDSLRTRMWVLRAWMEQGRSNDTLDALDALDHAGEKGLDMTYLYGMAFA